MLGISYDGFTRADGAGRSAPGAEGRRADEPDGRRLARRRLVPQRRLPPDRTCPTSTSRTATRDNDAKWWTSDYDDYDTFLRAGSAGELGRRSTASSRWASGARSSRTRPMTPSGRTRRWTRSSPRSPLTVPDDAGRTACGTRRTSTARSRSTRRSSRRTPTSDKVFLALGPGTTARDRRRQRARRDQVRQRHALWFRQQRAGAVPRRTT